MLAESENDAACEYCSDEEGTLTTTSKDVVDLVEPTYTDVLASLTCDDETALIKFSDRGCNDSSDIGKQMQGFVDMFLVTMNHVVMHHNFRVCVARGFNLQTQWRNH